MELYLCRPIKYSDLTYLEFWTKMTYSTKLTQYASNCIDRYYEQPLVSRTLRYYVMEKKVINQIIFVEYILLAFVQEKNFI